MNRFTVAAALVSMVLVGCDHNVYQIVIRPQAAGFERQLTVRRQGDKPENLSDLPKSELAAIEKVYGRGEGDKVRTYKKAFAGATPNDVGGAGTFARYRSSLGAAYAYAERFRGNDNLGEVIQHSLAVTDRIVDLLIGWLAKEVGTCEGFPKLRAFLDKQVRNDLKTVGAYAWLAYNNTRANWAAEHAHSNEPAKEALARAVLYLVERGYVTAAEVPAIKRTMDTLDKRKDKQTIVTSAVVQRILTMAGTDDGELLAQLTAMFARNKKLQASLDAYLRTTKEYKRGVREWQARPPVASGEKDRNEKPPEPVKVVSDKLGLERTFFNLRLNLFGTENRVEVVLHLATEPLATNGRYDEKTRTLRWRGQLTERNKPTPHLGEMCYAVWAEPNEMVQKQCFGKVILTGQRLYEYCVWRESVSPKEADRWTAVLRSIRPGADVKATVTSAARRVGISDAPRRAPGPYDKGAELILQAVGQTKNAATSQTATAPAP